MSRLYTVVLAATVGSAALWSCWLVHQWRQRRRRLHNIREDCKRQLRQVTAANHPSCLGRSREEGRARRLARIRDRIRSGKPIRVLSLDGGGVRGAFAARIMERIEEDMPEFVDSVDVFAGTSTGTLIAGLMCMGHSAAVTRKLFDLGAVIIFGLPPILRGWSPFHAARDGSNKNSVFSEIASGAHMWELERYLLAPTFRMHTPGDACTGQNQYHAHSIWHPDCISNFLDAKTGEDNPRHLDLPLYKVAMMATAAPTKFPVYEGFIDGGMFANTPALEGVSAILAAFPEVDISQIVVLSIGTGQIANSVHTGLRRAHWGLFQGFLEKPVELIDGSIEKYV
ncbi:uncharacterized protein MONBRDRAFT_34518 [Monosiga brevicollis MX1]|uniref:PNPLA domain-containing protein n=1 Tax=Monosiga brevicollis TaxID=81824 RepID=A9VC91_MONBE|nr:uncharacterized protein MONBRDRAFT_34518 [Monosiga brevicollis MX1]EDQ84819.1 predicted protein [Monosiga brevicollis MX1]|eukprot:XP_001750320.1 hypothetical protein [Monosiga brevicollis MX1]